MKVRELIEVLKKFNPEDEAVVGWEYAGMLLAAKAEIVDEGVFLDPSYFKAKLGPQSSESLIRWHDKFADELVTAVMIGGSQVDGEFL